MKDAFLGFGKHKILSIPLSKVSFEIQIKVKIDQSVGDLELLKQELRPIHSYSDQLK